MDYSGRKKLVDTKFSFKRLVNSFKYAFQGIKTAYIGEQNLKIHTFVAILVVIFGLIVGLSEVEWIVICTIIGLVLMAEFINTSLEFLVDLVSPEKNYIAKACKDTAAAAVLMMVIMSVIVGLIIFIPKIGEILCLIN